MWFGVLFSLATFLVGSKAALAGRTDAEILQRNIQREKLILAIYRPESEQAARDAIQTCLGLSRKNGYRSLECFGYMDSAMRTIGLANALTVGNRSSVYWHDYEWADQPTERVVFSQVSPELYQQVKAVVLTEIAALEEETQVNAPLSLISRLNLTKRAGAVFNTASFVYGARKGAYAACKHPHYESDAGNRERIYERLHNLEQLLAMGPMKDSTSTLLDFYWQRVLCDK